MQTKIKKMVGDLIFENTRNDFTVYIIGIDMVNQCSKSIRYTSGFI